MVGACRVPILGGHTRPLWGGRRLQGHQGEAWSDTVTLGASVVPDTT